MKRQLRRLMVLGCALALWTTAPQVSEAGIIPFVYDAIFGPVGSMQSYRANFGLGYGYGYAPYSSGYGGTYGGCSPCGTGACGTGGCGVQAYYAPSYGSYGMGGCGIGGCATGNCGFGNCGIGGCGIGGCATGNCPNGQCGLTSSASSAPVTPTPDNGVPRTYSEDPAAPADNGFAPRESDPDGFGPARFERPETPPTAIPQKEPAAPQPEIEEDGLDNAGPTLNLDDKVAWRPAPARNRLSLKSQYTSAKVTRKSSYPKAEWVAPPAAVAKK